MRGDEMVQLMFMRYRGHGENGNVIREFFFEGSDGRRYARRWADGPEGPRFELFEEYSVSELGTELDDSPVWPETEPES